MYMATAYPEEKDKGHWRGMYVYRQAKRTQCLRQLLILLPITISQWTCNVAGAAVGASVALGISWNSSREGVPHSVYIVFIVLQCCSLGLALLVRAPETLRRTDGTALAIFNPIGLTDSLRITVSILKDWRIIVLLPTFLAPETFFPFQASMNAYAFNLRTRVLNSLLNNLIQIPTTLGLGYLLDNEKLGSRRKRAMIGITAVSIWITGKDCDRRSPNNCDSDTTFSGTYIAQTIWLASWKFNRAIPGPEIDCTDPAYAGAVVIYIFYAAQYGIFQNCVIYVLVCLAEKPFV
jgi:hypothetical protein